MEIQCQNDISKSETMVLSIAGTQILRFDLMCRICGNETDKNISIYGPDGLTNELALKINTYLPIKVSEEDTLPLNCCYTCTSAVLTWHELVVNSVDADRKLREIPVVVNNPVVENEETVENEPDAILPTQCYSISETGTPSEKLDTHTKELSKSRYPCNLCDNTCFSQRNLSRHKERKHGIGTAKHACKICTENFDRKIDWVKHVRTHHKPKRSRCKADEKQAKFFCMVCGNGYTRKHDMQKHMTNKHPDHVPENAFGPIGKIDLRRCEIKTTNDKKAYKCDICPKIYMQSYNLVRHRRSHMDAGGTFMCELCGKQFSSTYTLNRHTEIYHPTSSLRKPIKRFRCKLCDKEFIAKTSLTQHMNIHTDSRPYICEICGKAFRQDSSLRIHKLYHSQVFRFSCDICGKKYRRRTELNVHMTLHTGVKAHRCRICDARFRLGATLKKHLLAHDRMNCECDVCGTKFTHRRYLTNHMRSHRDEKRMVVVTNTEFVNVNFNK